MTNYDDHDLALVACSLGFNVAIYLSEATKSFKAKDFSDCIRDIADEKLTLVETGAELRRGRSDPTSASEEKVSESRRTEREVATMIMQGLQ
jgi:hypothetical protein